MESSRTKQVNLLSFFAKRTDTNQQNVENAQQQHSKRLNDEFDDPYRTKKQKVGNDNNIDLDVIKNVYDFENDDDEVNHNDIDSISDSDSELDFQEEIENEVMDIGLNSNLVDLHSTCQHAKPPGPSDLSQNSSERPAQPITGFVSRKFGNTFRSFHINWYKDYSWLEYSLIAQGAFLFPKSFLSY